jgi:hypothetical protein
MTEIIAMAREAGFMPTVLNHWPAELKRLASLAQAAERNKVAAWMQAQGYATGHGDTIEGLLEELEREVGFKRAELWIKRISEAVLAEREAMLHLALLHGAPWRFQEAIRARGQAS